MTNRKGDVPMAKKRKRGQGAQHSLSSVYETVQKLKAAQYADKKIKRHLPENSPMGNYSRKEKISERSDDLIPVSDKKDNNGGEMPSDNTVSHISDDTAEAHYSEISERYKKAELIRQAAESMIAESRNETEAPTAEEAIEEAAAEEITDTAEAPQEDEAPEAKDNSKKEEKAADPKNDKRLKKAAYIRQMTAAKLAAERFATVEEEQSESGIYDNDAEHGNSYGSTQDYSQQPTAENRYEVFSATPDIIREKEKETDPQIVRRMKKAAYIKRMNEMKIAAAAVADVSEDDRTDVDTAEMLEENEEMIGDTAAPSDEEAPSEKYDSGTVSDEIREAYKMQYAYDHFYEHDSDGNYPSERKENMPVGIAEAAQDAAEYVSAVRSGNAVNAVTYPIKKLIDIKIDDVAGMRAVRTAAETINNSDSVGSAAAGAGTAAAANEVKRYVSRRLFVHTDKDDFSNTKRRKKQYRFIEREYIRQEKNDRRSEKQKRYKIKTADKKEAAKRNIQKNIYLKENKAILPFVPKLLKTNSYNGKNKLLIKVIAAFSTVFVVFFIIIVAVTLIASLFSWLSPFEYSLAGDDSNDPEISAESEAEVLDGYTLMIRNYLDVAQAYYYNNYGDWYGGTYDYPSAADELSFSRFLSEKCQYIIESIQQQFSAMIASAQTPEEANAIANAMSQAITNALSQAQEGAAEEYSALIEQLEDTMTAEENRQHYEVTDSGGPNGVKDSEEFDGKPIAGTNLFDNVEIQSDLSAEEMLAMIALYKSLKLAQTGGTSEDGTEYVYNITPEDIMTFFEETEFIPITAEVTHNNTCAGNNCKRRMTGSYESGYSWEYYCDGDHDNLSGSIENCISKDDLISKIMELTEAEDNGFDSDKCSEMIDEYLKLICDELEIDESDFRQFGASDNERAKEFYEILTDPEQGDIPNNYWNIQTPISEAESEDIPDE